MRKLNAYSLNRRNVIKGVTALAALVGSGVMAQTAMVPNIPIQRAYMALFTPNVRASRAFAADQRANGIPIHAVTDDISTILIRHISPTLGSNPHIIGRTPGHIPFILQEMLRDRGFAITQSAFVDARRIVADGAPLCATELNSAAIVDWMLEPSGIAFRS